jgi:outer membrane protein assembly factor BamB
MAAKDYANTRYSGLTEIAADNGGKLQVDWTFSTGVLMDGVIGVNALDAHTIGVAANSGKQLWKTKLGETITMAPVIIDGRALVGNAGADIGVRGSLAALDVKTLQYALT